MTTEQMKDALDQHVGRLQDKRIILQEKLMSDFNHSYEWGIADELYLVEAQLSVFKSMYSYVLSTDIVDILTSAKERIEKFILNGSHTRSQSTTPAKNRANQLKDEADRLVYSFITTYIE